MAQKIANYPVLDFSGGVRRDLSYFDFQKNELLDARNVDIDEKGRVFTRRGSHQIGQTLSNNIENSFVWERFVANVAGVNSIYCNDDDANATVRILRTTRLNGDITTATTTITVISTTGFSATGTIEIEGDLIAYTGVGATTFTGVTGISVNHTSGASVNQWVALSLADSLDGRCGVSYAVINNTLVIGGRLGPVNMIANDDGITCTAISGQPAGIGLTNYRDRLYVFGDGSSGTNGDMRRISFSNRGTGSTWTPATDTFLVEDQRGEGNTALKVLNDNLLIFKTNSIFTYDEIELKQRIAAVGAWNHKTPVEIEGVIYTFCPRGIFATNGFSAKQIGEPVRQYWENFQPMVDSISKRVVTNTFAARFKDNYILYIQDITDPTTTNDVTLVYDTKMKNWTVYTGFVDFQHFLGTEKYRYGDRTIQFRPALFSGAASGKYYRHFETRYIDGQSTPVKQGTDIFGDLVVDAVLTAGTPIAGEIETPLYDLTHPELFKTFKNIRVYTENGQWNFQYRIQNDDGISNYKQLGTTSKTMKVLSFPKEAQGYRVGLKITATNTSSQAILNGFTFENTEVTARK